MDLEIIVTSVAEAIQAEKFGATRLELIDSFYLGGCSPTLSLSREVASAVQIPVNVMVRPHGVGFNLSENDMSIVLHEIEYLLANTKVNGIVFGSLTVQGNINFKQLDAVSDLLCNSNRCLTFHRAIDATSNIQNNFYDLVQYSLTNNILTSVLTSGGYPSAINGLNNIKYLNNLIAILQSKLKIIIGSGITLDNIDYILQDFMVNDIHLGRGVRDDQDKFLVKNCEYLRQVIKIKSKQQHCDLHQISN